MSTAAINRAVRSFTGLFRGFIFIFFLFTFRRKIAANDFADQIGDIRR